MGDAHQASRPRLIRAEPSLDTSASDDNLGPSDALKQDSGMSGETDAYATAKTVEERAKQEVKQAKEEAKKANKELKDAKKEEAASEAELKSKKQAEDESNPDHVKMHEELKVMNNNLQGLKKILVDKAKGRSEDEDAKKAAAAAEAAKEKAK